jgi:superfamily I DNA/RNA helicase
MIKQVKTFFGPPGTGKTTTLMSVLEQTLLTYKPEDIAFISFTKAGANEGISRAFKPRKGPGGEILPSVGEQFGLNEKQFIYFRTMHSLAYRHCNIGQGQVIGERHYKELSEQLKMEFRGYYNEDLNRNDDQYLFYMQLERNNPRTAETMRNELSASKLDLIKRNYEKYKADRGLWDYTDMVEKALAQEIVTPVKVCFLDESQDFTNLQWRYAWSTFRNCDIVYIAGDDDQAIYEWSGADVQTFLAVGRKEKSHIETLCELKPGFFESTEFITEILKHSYRLPDNILKMSKTITSQMFDRIEKEYNGKGVNGELRFTTSLREMEFNDTDTYLLLSRNNWYLDEYENILRDRGLPYLVRKFGGDFKASVMKSDVAAVNLYEAARKKGELTKAEHEKLSMDLKPDYKITSPWYSAFNWHEIKINYIRNVIKNKTRPDDVRIKVSTIHSVKGAEADHVVLLLNMSKASMISMDKNADSEHRVFYVGMTRAAKSLTIVFATNGCKHEYPIDMRSAKALAKRN